ncbi:MAG: hypothetical protein NTX22_17765 [Ignavibacteriales bacterium]|nr:hypothetical protein [Ignavibacteriales bacterium]
MRKIFFLIIVALFFISCSKEETTPPTQNTTNPFAGTWQFTFSGDYTGSNEATIRQGYTFRLPIIFTKSDSTTLDSYINCTVSPDGILTGQTFFAGAQIGTIEGKLSGSSGNGTWETYVPTHGTWKATKK